MPWYDDLRMSDWDFCGTRMNPRCKTDCDLWASLDWANAIPYMSSEGVPEWSVGHFDECYHAGCFHRLVPRLGRQEKMMIEWLRTR